jgi:hypothetical protein
MEMLLGVAWGILLVFNLYLLVHPQHVREPRALSWCLTFLLLAFAVTPLIIISRDMAKIAGVIGWVSTGIAYILTISTCGIRLLGSLSPPRKDSPPPQA